MSVTIASLRTQYPEFGDTPDAVLERAIAQAERRVDADVLSDRTDDAVTLLACHLATATPYGGGGELTRDKSRTIYWQDYHDLVILHGGARGVI
jgi:hypothetical protein